MYTLGIDTSNYATSVSIVDGDCHKVIFNSKQFLPVEQGKIGIRQQQALFYHIKNLTDVFSDFKRPEHIGAVGVSVRPKSDENSYMPCFLRGKMRAYSIGGALGVPVVETSHQTGHLTSALYYLNDEDLFNRKVLMMHISGGTTDIMLAQNGNAVETIGSSLDLFAGQAVDRLGVKFGFPFPAGAYVSDLAANCTENIGGIKVSVNGTYCNLSGLENQCDNLLKSGFGKEYVCRYCLEFIAATRLKMIQNAKKMYGDLPVIMAGGVMSSKVIKEIFKTQMPEAMFVSPEYSRDNGIGVAVNAYRKLKNG